MAEPTDRDAGFDDWLDALADGSGYYLACPRGHGSLPPRRACPHCGELDLSHQPLPSTGEIVTYTVVHVPTPQLADDAPYATAIAAFEPVRLTGFVRGIDPDDVEVGIAVAPGVETTRTTGERAVVFRPADR